MALRTLGFGRVSMFSEPSGFLALILPRSARLGIGHSGILVDQLASNHLIYKES